jgi:diadenosine tetraphosphate (Ap4A) HIT family hydrolase
LIVPKRPYPSFLSLPADDPELWKEFIEIVQSLVQELELEKVGYRLIVNGGPYQDFPHAHFHLVSGDGKDIKSVFLAGDFFIEVQDGWVYISESAFPGMVGGVMKLFHLEGTP